MRIQSAFGLFVLASTGIVNSASAIPLPPTVGNPGFEAATTPALSNPDVEYTTTYGPISSVPDWTFGPSGGPYSYDGMSRGATFANENHGAASGNQNAFIQGTGTISQSIDFSPGIYTLSVDAISRTNGGESIPEPT